MATTRQEQAPQDHHILSTTTIRAFAAPSFLWSLRTAAAGYFLELAGLAVERAAYPRRRCLRLLHQPPRPTRQHRHVRGLHSPHADTVEDILLDIWPPEQQGHFLVRDRVQTDVHQLVDSSSGAA